MNIPAAKIVFSEDDRQVILQGIDECLKSGQLTLGKNTQQFETEFAKTAGVKFACAVSSGTAALEIALRAFNVAGKEVLVPTNTFFATAAAVVHAGGRPKFVDTDPTTLSIDLSSLEKRWTPVCAGAIVVHIGGAIPPYMEDIVRFCQSKGMFLLEDAAHAHGSMLNDKPAGSFGSAAAFSFYPTKVITSGEGGMLVTNDERMYQEALLYRDQGKASFSSNVHVRVGYNWRMSELHAVVGQVHLSHLDSFISERRKVAAWYDQGLQSIPELQPCKLSRNSKSNYYKYPVFLPPSLVRQELKREMREQWSVSLSGEVYELPCHEQPVFASYVDTALPVAEEVCRRHICLPVFSGMTEDQAKYVLKALKDTVKKLHKEVHH